jgi:hypothetical protein
MTKLYRLFIVILLVGMVRPAPVAAQNERLVLAFYYAWFDQTTWQQPLPDLPNPTYTSSDPATIERHVLWAQQAGIDALVQSWYGPQTQNNQTETNFVTLLNTAGQYGLKAALDLEVSNPFIASEAAVIAAIQHALTVHAAHPAYLRVGGRPVLFFWRQEQYSVQWWQSVRDQIDPQRTSIWIMEGVNLDYLGPFDGNHLYSVAWDTVPEGTLTRWGQHVRDWSAQNGVFKYWVATVMPGYDDRVTGRSDAFARDRANGDYYRRCWQGAVQSGADWVIVTSFNEWMEGSQIEPSAGYGDFYLTLTREQAAGYRATVAPPTTEAPVEATLAPTETPAPLPTPLPTVPPTDTPTPTPTPTFTPMATPTETPSPTPTETPSPTPTLTPSATSTPTLTPTATPTPMPIEVPTSAWLPSAVIGVGIVILLLIVVAALRVNRPAE